MAEATITVSTEPQANEATSSSSSNDKKESISEYESCFFEAFGEGNSKKVSKNNSAIEMLKILKDKFEPLFMISSKKTNNFAQSARLGVKAERTSIDATIDNPKNANQPKKLRKNKAKNIVKLKKTNPDYGKGSINPISRLIQIQQAKKEPEPQFTLIVPIKKKNESNSRKSEFIIQVTLETSVNKAQEGEGEVQAQPTKFQCEGKGSTKKLAKQNAAEAMLIKLGYQPKQAALKPSIKSSTSAGLSSSVKTSHPTQSALVSNEPLTESETSTNADKLNVEKNEKRVTFVEDNNVTIQPEEYKNATFTSITGKMTLTIEA